jgi:hypothetical protein
MPIDFFKHEDTESTGDPPTIEFERKVHMTNAGSSTKNKTLVWTDPDAAATNQVTSITTTGGALGIISDKSSFSNTNGTASWDSNGAVTTSNHNTLIEATIQDGDGNTESATFTLEVYATGTTKITSDKPVFEFCIGDTQQVTGLWIDNNIDKIEVRVDGGSWSTANYSGFQGGTWDFTPGTALTAGTYAFEAKITDLDGTPNTDTVAFTVIICNDLAADPVIAFDQDTYERTLPITSQDFTGTYTAPGASASSPVTLTMEIYNAVDEAWETITGTFSGYDDEDDEEQSWTWNGSPQLIHERQLMRVTLSEGGAEATAETLIDFNYDDPLQLIGDHPCYDPNDSNWVFWEDGAPSQPTWVADAIGGGATYHEAQTDLEGGVLIGDDEFSIRLTASSANNTARKYTPQFQIENDAGFGELSVALWVNGTLVEDFRVYGTALYNGTYETNVDLQPINAYDGDELEIRFRVEGITDDDEKALWAFSDILSEELDTEYLGPGIYVDGDATTNGDGTFENPYNSWTSAVSAAADNTTMYVKRGTTLIVGGRHLFDELTNFHIKAYGAAAAKPRLDGELDQSASSQDNAFIAPIELRNCQDCSVSDIEVYRAGFSGIVVKGTSKSGIQEGRNITLNRCDVRYVRNWGIFVSGKAHDAGGGRTAGTVYDVTVSNCTGEELCLAVEENGGQYGSAGGEGMHASRCDNVTFEDCTVYFHHKEAFIVNDGATGVTFHRCKVHSRNNTAYGGDSGAAFYIDGSTNGVSDIEVAYCIASDDSKGCSITTEVAAGADMDDIRILNNLFFNHDGQGMTFPALAGTVPVCENVKVFNNTIVHSQTGAHTFLINETDSTRMTGLEVKGNIIVNTTGDTSESVVRDKGGAPSGAFDYNVIYNQGNSVGSGWTQGSNSTNGDPDFEEHTDTDWPMTTDYYPSASSSAVELLTGSTYVSDDINTTSRPQSTYADAGCYERT